jgi:hypothetical protein
MGRKAAPICLPSAKLHSAIERVTLRSFSRMWRCLLLAENHTDIRSQASTNSMPRSRS